MSRRILIAAALSLTALAVASPVRAAPAEQQQNQQQSSRKIYQKTIGPWAVIAWVAPSGSGYCSAERVVGETTIAFVRFTQGYALILRSNGWQLEPNGHYPVKFNVAFVPNGAAEGRVLAPNLILVQLTSDPEAMRRLSGNPSLEVVAAETTISVPLDQFGDALAELETCLAQSPQPGKAQQPPRQQPSERHLPPDPNLPAGFPGAPGHKPDLKADGLIFVDPRPAS